MYRIWKVDKSVIPNKEECVTSLVSENYASVLADSWQKSADNLARLRGYVSSFVYEVREDIQKFGEDEITKP